MRTPKYCLHTTSGQARVTINGRAYYLGQYDSAESWQKYHAKIAEWLASGCSKTFGIIVPGITILGLVEAYRPFAIQYFGTGINSEAKSTDYSVVPLLELYGSSVAEEFGSTRFEAVRSKMIEMGWSRGYINASMQRVKRVFKWGAEQGYFPSDVFARLRLISGLQFQRSKARECKPVKPVCENLVEQTLKNCSPIVADMVRVQLLCGCRPGEIVTLTPGMIDRSDSVWVANLVAHKTAYLGKERIIHFGQACQSILAKYMDRPNDCCLFSPAEAERLRRSKLGLDSLSTVRGWLDDERSSTDSSGKRKVGSAYTRMSYTKSVKLACKKTFPIPKKATTAEAKAWKAKYWWSPLRVRHTAGTRFRKEFGIDVAAALLGHCRVETTQIYAEINYEKASEAMRRIG